MIINEFFPVLKTGDPKGFQSSNLCASARLNKGLTGDPKGFQSSNLCASARLNKGLPKGNPFVFWALRI
ncbi:hypothetical protein B5Z95_00175 [Salmonella enterica subsp. enterica serovar Newport]|nr:hypothetical protein B5Z95_00175 [Salmonella enterica subsp. enterica serovar Newport]